MLEKNFTIRKNFHMDRLENFDLGKELDQYRFYRQK